MIKKCSLVLLFFLVSPVYSYYIETHKLTEQEFEFLNKKAIELGIDKSHELLRIISWRHGKLMDDDFYKFSHISYAPHKQGLYYETSYVLSCSGMKKSGWTCRKHKDTVIRLVPNKKKNIHVSIDKEQKIESVIALAKYAYTQKPTAWNAEMSSVAAQKDNVFEVSYKNDNDCYFTQKVRMFKEMGTISYQVDTGEITSFLACKKDVYAGFQEVLLNYIIYEKSQNEKNQSKTF